VWASCRSKGTGVRVSACLHAAKAVTTPTDRRGVVQGHGNDSFDSVDVMAVWECWRFDAGLVWRSAARRASAAAEPPGRARDWFDGRKGGLARPGSLSQCNGWLINPQSGRVVAVWAMLEGAGRVRLPHPDPRVDGHDT